MTTAAQAESSLYFPGNGRARHENNQYAPCRYPVALPSRDHGWNWGFHSCNGLSAGADLRAGKDPHLWEDVMAVHGESPMHAMCGGGDQIYNDALWQEPSMQAWVSGVGTEVW